MLERFRRNELTKLKVSFDKDYEEYLNANFGVRDAIRTSKLLPKWGHCLPTPDIVERIVGWYKQAAVVNPQVKIYDVGCGTGMLLVMLYLAGVPYEALVGVDLPRGIRDASEPRYWKVIENRNYEVPKEDILLISFGEQLNHAAKRYVAYGGDKVILIGSKSGSGCFQQPPVDIFQGRPEWSVESHMLPVNEVHGKYHNYITYNTR